MGTYSVLFFYNFTGMMQLKKIIVEFIFYAMISALSGAIILAARYSAYLGRIVIYTDIYNTLFWASMLSKFPKGKKKYKAMDCFNTFLLFYILFK